MDNKKYFSNNDFIDWLKRQWLEQFASQQPRDTTRQLGMTPKEAIKKYKEECIVFFESQ